VANVRPRQMTVSTAWRCRLRAGTVAEEVRRASCPWSGAAAAPVTWAWTGSNGGGRQECWVYPNVQLSGASAATGWFGQSPGPKNEKINTI